MRGRDELVVRMEHETLQLVDSWECRNRRKRAAAMNLRPRRREEPDLNLVPMIHVVLVLFDLLDDRHQPAARVGPGNSVAGSVGPADARYLAELEVDIDASGRYALNGQALETGHAATLKAALHTAAQGRELPLILRADGRMPHQAVVMVLEVAGQLGLKQLAIATVNALAAAPASPPTLNASPSPYS